MPLSTSSSDERAPARPWLLVWALAALITLAPLITLECVWRAKGYQPGLRDGYGLWARARRSLQPGDPNQVVFIGDSRVQNSVNLDVFDERWPGPRPVQLAIVNSAAAPMLAHLANDETFIGVVVSSTSRFDLMPASNHWIVARDYVNYYQQLTPAEIVDQRVSAFLQQRLALLLPDLGPHQVMEGLQQGKWPDESCYRLYPDRGRDIDYSKFKSLAARRKRLTDRRRFNDEGFLTPEQIARGIDGIARSVARIQSRGGRVVFVRYPSSGALRELERELFPRSVYWDRWSRIGAVSVHFEDYPELSDFDCPDYVHIDQKDTARFSRALAPIIARKLSEGR